MLHRGHSLASDSLTPEAVRSSRVAKRRSVLSWLGLAAASLLIVPAIFATVRDEADRARLENLIAKSRWGEAEQLARHLRTAAPHLRIHGERLNVVAGILADRIETLEDAVRSIPDASAPPESHLAHARQLAMLGREDAAVQHLDSYRLATPEALNLLGTIEETRSNWPAAEEHFRRALSGSETRESRLPALTGLGYALRKQGRYRDAEGAYLQLWALAPTADTAFLLAQFYEDTQQPASANTFTRRAMELDPLRYSAAGTRLLETLRTRHFGCFAVPK